MIAVIFLLFVPLRRCALRLRWCGLLFTLAQWRAGYFKGHVRRGRVSGALVGSGRDGDGVGA